MKKTEGNEFKRQKTVSLTVLILLWLTVPSQTFLAAGEQSGLSDESVNLSETQITEIEKYIRGQMKRGKIPGLSVVIVKGDKTIYKNGFGFANIKNKQQVNEKTLFEIGANSKAFTALGILRLEEEGKLKLDDPVNKHIPWFKMKYKGQEVSITIEQLLYHTSGIPFETVADIPESGLDNALEETVRTLVDKELNNNPGTEFSYATINYDVLGLIIEKVSGVPFEEFMKKNIMELLGLKNTYMSRNEAMEHDMATGYKIEFLAPREYKAPVYRGNTPAGYFITNAEDVERWLKIQLGTIDIQTPFRELIEKSHQPNENVIGFRYAKGWFVFQGREIFHAGNNPNFSSFIVLSRPENIGITVLANINSSLVESIGWGILSILTQIDMPEQSKDFYMKWDRMSVTFIGFVTLSLLISVILNFMAAKNVLKKRKKFKFTNKGLFKLGIATLLLLGILYLLSILPTFLSYDLPWNVITVWAPITFGIIPILLAFTGISFYINFFLRIFFPIIKVGDQKDEI